MRSPGRAIIALLLGTGLPATGLRGAEVPPPPAEAQVDRYVAKPRVLVMTDIDPDGDALTFRWLFYPEAATGIPGHPVFAGRLPRPETPGAPPPVRVVVENAGSHQATVIPKLAGIAHVILAVEDGGSPSLTSYRRISLEISPSAP
jgi:hypothetical protein